MNKLYDFDKETDKDFLRAAGKMMQNEIITLRLELHQQTLLQQQNEQIKSTLTGQLLVLRRLIFDSKQEKKEKAKGRKNKNRKKGKKLVHNQNDNKNALENDPPLNIQLVTDEIEHELKTECCPGCSGNDLDELLNFFDESTEYDVNNTYYILKRHKRKKYKCKECNKIITAEGPEKLVSGGQFSTQIAVKIATDKFEHHLPLERQRKIMNINGLSVSVKTLFSLTEHLYNLLYELNEMNRLEVLGGDYVCIDESPMPFYNKSKSNGYVMTLSNNVGAYYQFEPIKNSAIIKELMKGFEGVVMTDALNIYDFLDKADNIIHALCWAHFRRYFYDAMLEDKEAGDMVDYIDELYEIEHLAKDLDDLKYLRSKHSTEIYEKIKNWIDINESKYLKQTLTGKAINYYYNQKEGLEKFLKNENIPLDNNMAERRQRCPVMGRNNFGYFRSINGADVGMFFYSIIESCKTNGLIASSYLQDMAIKKLKGEELETPYKYASKLKSGIEKKILNELLTVSNSS